MTDTLAAACRAPAEGPAVWKAADFEHDRSWLHRLSDEQAGCLARAAREFDGQDLARATPEWAARHLVPLAMLMREVKRELGTRGFVLLRGVPVRELGDKAGLAFWMLGALLGTGLTQNADGDLLCPVTDKGVRFDYSAEAHRSNARGYQSRADLNYHCDPTDVVALLCVNKAMSGGASTIVSTPAVYNALLADHPEHMEVLERGFPYDRKGEQWPQEAPVSPRIPVFVRHGARVSCRYARSYIEGAAAKLGTPLEDAERAALDCFDSVVRRPDMALHMAFEPGDVQLLNNFTVVHGRTAYEDDPDPAKRRFLYRLWLHLGDSPPWQGESQIMRWAFARFGNLGRTAQEWSSLRSET